MRKAVPQKMPLYGHNNGACTATTPCAYCAEQVLALVDKLSRAPSALEWSRLDERARELARGMERVYGAANEIGELRNRCAGQIAQITSARDAAITRADQCAETNGILSRKLDELKAKQATPDPIPMLLYCPECKARHIDAPHIKPHRTHACQKCGHLWSLSAINTVGVQFLPGCKD